MYQFFRDGHCVCKSSVGNRILARKLHLVHDIFAPRPSYQLDKLRTKIISDIELAPCKLVESPSGSEDSIVTLHELLPMIQPFHYLEAEGPQGSTEIKAEEVANLRYKIVELPVWSGPWSRQKDKKHKRLGSSKEIHLTTSLRPGAFKHFLGVAAYILQKRDRVEFHLRAKRGNKAMTVDWALQNLPHLRPEVILRSMPEGTSVFIPPVVNKRLEELIWAFSNKESESFRPEGMKIQWRKGSQKWQNSISRSKLPKPKPMEPRLDGGPKPKPKALKPEPRQSEPDWESKSEEQLSPNNESLVALTFRRVALRDSELKITKFASGKQTKPSLGPKVEPEALKAEPKQLKPEREPKPKEELQPDNESPVALTFRRVALREYEFIFTKYASDKQSKPDLGPKVEPEVLKSEPKQSQPEREPEPKEELQKVEPELLKSEPKQLETEREPETKEEFQPDNLSPISLTFRRVAPS